MSPSDASGSGVARCDGGRTDQSTDGTDRCVVCGADLSDPKKRGDPDVNDDWVCSNRDCRIIHEPEMTCNIVRGSL